MARALNRLNAKQVKNLNDEGRYADGGNLYLAIKNGGKSWTFRYTDRATGKEHTLGLGAVHTVTLAQARAQALQQRQALAAGLDPLDTRRQDRRAAALRQARTMTFGQCCAAYIEAHRPGWRNIKHGDQWTATLATYAAPITSVPVAEIDTAMVLKCLQPHWTDKTETLTRVRQRIEKVLDWAAVGEFRHGANPARWKGHLENRLAAPAKVKVVVPRSSLPYAELRKRAGIGARAVELLVLTACRPGEVAGALWAEIDLDAATWTIPGSRTKSGMVHRIALSVAAVALLKALQHDGDTVFTGLHGKPITTAAMLKAARMIRAGIDVHGFRTSFRTWAAERTNVPREIAELALGHAVKGVEAVYQRSDLIDKRAKLMADWATYIDTPAATGNVTPIRKVLA
jgi:integrase